MRKILLIGEVVSGREEGRKYVELAWVRQQMAEKLGFTPFPGTLNLRLEMDSVKQRSFLDRDAAVGVCQSEGYCAGLLFKASIIGVACAAVVPQVENYPDDLLEVVASVNLRQELHLHDGDEVEVIVFL